MFQALDSDGCDSVVSVMSFEKPVSSLRYIDDDKVLSPITNVDFFETRRQDIKQMLYEVNGSIFASKVESLKKYKSFHQEGVKGYLMPRTESFDINNMDDWYLAEAYAMYKERYGK